MFDKKFPWGKVATAFIIGAAAGAVTAFLVAPMTGRKLQKQIRNVVEDQVDNAEKMMRKVVNA